MNCSVKLKKKLAKKGFYRNLKELVLKTRSAKNFLHFGLKLLYWEKKLVIGRCGAAVDGDGEESIASRRCAGSAHA